MLYFRSALASVHGGLLDQLRSCETNQLRSLCERLGAMEGSLRSGEYSMPVHLVLVQNAPSL